MEGTIIGIFAIAKDITNLKKTAIELAESELKFSSIVDEAFIGVYIVQEDGKISYGNEKFYEMLGIVYSTTGVNFRDYVHPEDIPGLNALGKVLMNGETGMTHTYRMIRKDGTILDVESHSAKVYLQNKPHMVGYSSRYYRTQKSRGVK